MTVNKVSLNDRFDLEKKIVIASGTQALVRLMLNQAVRDRVNGINSAGLVTGYRGSPLGGVDATFTKAEKFLKKNNIKLTVSHSQLHRQLRLRPNMHFSQNYTRSSNILSAQRTAHENCVNLATQKNGRRAPPPNLHRTPLQ